MESILQDLIDLEDAKKRFKTLKMLPGVSIELEDGLKFLDEVFEIELSYKVLNSSYSFL